MAQKVLLILLLFLPSFAAAQVARVLTVATEPDAFVWIDDVAYGKTDSNGKITFRTFAVGRHKLRVRAFGFKEITQNLLPAQKGQIRISLVPTNDEAELAFQKAELETDKAKSVELYQKAIELRPNFPEALIGLARQQAALGDSEDALNSVRAARKLRPGYALASAVEGRIHKDDGEYEKAIAAFKRAITEGKGIQPEAHTGLGLLFKEKAESFASEGDSDAEIENYLLAAAEFRKAVQQLLGAPDAIIIYQMLGDCYERAGKWADAIKIYEEFLDIFPDVNEAEMFRSFIVQAKKRLNGER